MSQTVAVMKSTPYHTPRAGNTQDETEEDDMSGLAPVQAPKATVGNKYINSI